jgi:hypothetical protein
MNIESAAILCCAYGLQLASFETFYEENCVSNAMVAGACKIVPYKKINAYQPSFVKFKLPLCRLNKEIPKPSSEIIKFRYSETSLFPENKNLNYTVLEINIRSCKR